MAANGIYDAEANAILDARLSTSASADLMTTMPTASGGTASGTKVTGGSYAQQTAALSTAASREKHSTATVTFAGLPDTTTTTVKGIDLGGKWFMPFTTAIGASAGSSISFAASGISASFANGT